MPVPNDSSRSGCAMLLFALIANTLPVSLSLEPPNSSGDRALQRDRADRLRRRRLVLIGRRQLRARQRRIHGEGVRERHREARREARSRWSLPPETAAVIE